MPAAQPPESSRWAPGAAPGDAATRAAEAPVEAKSPALRPHRCNARLEDVVQALFEGNPWNTLPGPARLLRDCLRARPGEEPIEPFFYYKPEHAARVREPGGRV